VDKTKAEKLFLKKKQDELCAFFFSISVYVMLFLLQQQLGQMGLL